MQVVWLLVEQKRDWLSSVPFYIIYKRFVSIDLTVMSMDKKYYKSNKTLGRPLNIIGDGFQSIVTQFL